jgi:hypothetical protein
VTRYAARVWPGDALADSRSKREVRAWQQAFEGEMVARPIRTSTL